MTRGARGHRRRLTPHGSPRCRRRRRRRRPRAAPRRRPCRPRAASWRCACCAPPQSWRHSHPRHRLHRHRSQAVRTRRTRRTRTAWRCCPPASRVASPAGTFWWSLFRRTTRCVPRRSTQPPCPRPCHPPRRTRSRRHRRPGCGCAWRFPAATTPPRARQSDSRPQPPRCLWRSSPRQAGGAATWCLE